MSHLIAPPRRRSYARYVTPLEQLLEHAEQATPGERIELRDSIAAHGTDALATLSTWLEDARLRLFAARVIERIAKDHRQPALHARRAARDGVPATVGREKACRHDSLHQ